ncbi:hypothetical protein JCM10831_17940 [Hydrogenophilus hirschii]
MLEVLVALTIAAMAFAVVYRSVGQSVLIGAKSRERTEAATVVRSLMALAAGRSELLAQRAGVFSGWHWQVEVRPVTVAWQPDPPLVEGLDPTLFDPAALPPLYALDWTLTPSTSAKTSLHFVSYVLDPAF